VTVPDWRLGGDAIGEVGRGDEGDVSKLKQPRRVTTRFEETARKYLAVVTLVAPIR
jgi:hypothetical protein